MTSRGRKFEELPTTITIGDDDLFVMSKVVGSNTITSTITGADLKRAIVSGPYETDAAANTAGVGIGSLYYTSAGVVKVRLV